MSPGQTQAHNRLHGQTLLVEWQARAKLYAEGNKLYAEGNKLRAEGNKLRAEGNKLYAEGDYAWACAILVEFGNVTTVWGVDGSCTLGCGEVYEVAS